MLLSLDLSSETPIYVQLRNSIVHGIATNQLSVGESLPSVRQMASDLGINLHTVNKVYTMLKSEGFLTVHRQKGVVVNSPEQYVADSNYMSKLLEQLEPLIAESCCRGISHNEFKDECTKLYTKISNAKKMNLGGENK